jgi:tartrate dehydratase beta subunit/fumarate hydratase class I family protein
MGILHLYAGVHEERRLLLYLYDAGIAATIGKGVRSQAVRDACVRNGVVYFVTVGGAAAYLAKCVESSITVAYDDLGTEALRRIDVVDFPVFVGVDTTGADVYGLSAGE